MKKELSIAAVTALVLGGAYAIIDGSPSDDTPALALPGEAVTGTYGNITYTHQTMIPTCRNSYTGEIVNQSYCESEREDYTWKNRSLLHFQIRDIPDNITHILVPTLRGTGETAINLSTGTALTVEHPYPGSIDCNHGDTPVLCLFFEEGRTKHSPRAYRWILR